MKQSFLLLLCLLFIQAAFSQEEALDYRLTEISEDPTYGYTPENPIKVGHGPTGERYFLDQLIDKKGKKVKYVRLGSCCHFETESEKAYMGVGLLDKYKVKGKGSKAVILYLNMYDFEAPKGVMNFGIR